MVSSILAQTTSTAPKETIQYGYAVHQSIDVGGHIANVNGSRPMYDTLVNLQTGPRILQQSIELHPAEGQKHFFLFDTLMTASMGYGGDPYNSTMLKMSKGKLYDFQGTFLRDREYFDYDLLDNPLIPPGVTSNGYTFPQALQSPHLYNLVRRMTDTDLTLFPLSKVTVRASYFQNISQGPSFSSLHNGAEAQLLQNWRNSTDSWMGALDWKPLSATVLTFQETLTHYKGNTSWQLAGPYLQLPNSGGPVTLGYDQVNVPRCNDENAPILNSGTTPPTVNPTCAGFQQLTRYAPMRTLFPTEEFRFQSSDIRNLQMTGRFRYTGASMNMPNFDENFLGLDDFGIRQWNITGYSRAERVSVDGDFAAVWKLSPRLTATEQYDFWDFRQPADNYLSEIDHLDDANPNTPSMADPPGAAQPPAITAAHNFLGQKTETNTVSLSYRTSAWATFTLGYRYRARTIGYEMPLVTDFLANGTSYSVPIHTNGGFFGTELHPTAQWKIDGTVEAAYADNAYVQLDPRQMQRYQVHSMWSPKSWATITGTFDDLERRDKQILVNHVDHVRDAAIGADLSPSAHYGMEFNYGYMDAFSMTGICYSSSIAPASIPAAPADCGTNTFLGNGYYDEPTEYGSAAFMLTPTKRLQSTIGYRMNAVHGTTEVLNPREVPGSLQSDYQTPFAHVTWTVAPGWAFSGNWDYYSYGENGPVGPTLSRAFHSNLTTIGMHYEF